LFLRAAQLDTPPPETGQICNRLGGLPLELVLAGQHLAVTGQPAGALLEALDQAQSAELPGLTAVFQQLPDALKGVILNLGATFSGSATTALLEVLQLSPTDTVMRVTEMLVARGLAQIRPCHEGTQCHYLHALVRDFARDWLRDGQRWELAQVRLHEAVLAYVEQHHTDSRAARVALVAEMPNILGLARYAVAQRDADTVQRLYAVLTEAFDESGAYGYELARLEVALDQISRQGTESRDSAVADEYSEAAEYTPDAPPAFAGEPEDEDVYDTSPVAVAPAQPKPGAQAPEAMLADFVEDGLDTDDDVEDLMDSVFPEDEMADFEEDVATVSDFETDADEAFSAGVQEMAGAGAMEAAPQRPAQPEAPLPAVGVNVALDDLLKASREARESGDRGRLASALIMLARAWSEQGQYPQAQAAYAEALALREQSGQETGLLEVLEALAGISLEMGDLENAVVYATRAQNLAAQEADPVRLGHVLALLGDVRLELGALDEAVETYVDAIEALQAGDDEVSLGVVQAKLGATHMDRGEYTRAITMLSSAQVIFADAGLTEYEGRVLGNLGAAYGHLNQWQEAESHHREALTIAQVLDDAEEQERQLANLGYAAQAQEDWDSMEDYYRAALDLAYQLENTEWQLRYLDVLGRLLMDNVNQVELAVMLLEEAQRLNPDQERLRLLNRATKRLLRLEQSGIVQEGVPPSIEEWAAGHSV
ncbi:MAG: tetratricopeptide repeat protein, partial [Anaerolineae bacterium]|nr:tetratricopeptide repeat protein [Anaerolineae bacterium]